MVELTWKEARLLIGIALVLIGGGAIKALRPLLIPQAPPFIGGAALPVEQAPVSSVREVDR